MGLSDISGLLYVMHIVLLLSVLCTIIVKAR